MKAILYTHETCMLCEEAAGLLSVVQAVYDVEIEERDIHTNDEWLDAYFLSVPVIEIAGKQFMYPEITFEIIAAHIEEIQEPPTRA